MRFPARGALLVATLCFAAGVARAHAPLARTVAVAPDAGGGMAVRMPGFGLVVRADEQSPFAYACDALLGIEPTETVTPLVYRGDGALLIGTRGGLRIVGADGCPAATSAAELAGVPIAALAVHPDDANLVYAVSTGAGAAIYRSDDGGEHWQLRSQIGDGEPISALLLARGNADLVYVSRPSGMQSSLLVSEDAGATFETFQQERALALLHVESVDAQRLLAMARNPDRTVAILRAVQPQGPWAEVARVNFFGGFAIDPSGALWVGDEGGSVFRSGDGGDSWQDVQPDAAVACLVHGRDALWACTPGTPRQRAVARLADAADASAELEDVTTLAAVDALVDCGAELDVAQTCASAWNEWRVDVLQQAAPPAGAAGSPATTGGAGAAGSPVTTPGAQGATGCRVTPRVGGASEGRGASCLLFALLALSMRTARRFPGRRRYRRLDGMPSARAPRSTELEAPLPSDGELMRRAGQGEVEAFAAIYDRHAPALLALAQRMLSARSEAQDLLHDVFLEAWQCVREYDPARAGVRTWLLVRTRSRALDRMARRAREQDARSSLRPDQGVRAHASTSAADRRVTVRQALDELDASVRETLELSYFAGLTAEEIAARMDVPSGTVKSRLARGLQQLERVLRDLGGAGT
jgi:RNA polymerase sigma-70 factor (ECF subfamily)